MSAGEERGRSAGPSIEHGLALNLVQAAPDPVWLADPDGVFQAVPPDVTLVTNLLGPNLTQGLLFFALRV
jgi:hypothetical protein